MDLFLDERRRQNPASASTRRKLFLCEDGTSGKDGSLTKLNATTIPAEKCRNKIRILITGSCLDLTTQQYGIEMN